MPTSPTLIKLKTEAARSFLRDVTNENDIFHVFFGRTEAWGNPDTPPTPTDTRLVDAQAHVDMMAIKRVQPSDVVYLIPKILWDETCQTVYDRYDDNVDLSIINFFIFNDENKCIYKCLNSPNYVLGVKTGHAPSTVKPEEVQSAEKFMTSDGYWWKLMYKVPDADFEKFVDINNIQSYIPVRVIPSVSLFDVKGHIPYMNGITILNTGRGYQTPPFIIISGDGKGAYAKAIINMYGELVDVVVENEGYGYSYATAVVVGGNGTDAELLVDLSPDGPVPEDFNVIISATAHAKAGSIEFIDILNVGQNFSGDTVFGIVGDGTGATLNVFIAQDGTIESISTANPGKGYTSAEIVILDGPGDGASFKPILSPIWGHGGNIPTELLATTVGIVVDVETPFRPPTPEGDFFRGNDFRQVGVIKNIRSYGIYGTSTSFIGDSSYLLAVSDIAKYHVGDVISTDGGGTFSVLEVNADGVKNVVRLDPVIDIIISTSVLTNMTTLQSLAPFGLVKINESRPRIAEIFLNSTGDACYKIGVSDLSNYKIDDVITTDGGGKFIVVELNPYQFNPSNDIVKLLPIIDIISLTSVLTNITTAATPGPYLDPLISLALPEINKKTGDIIYLKNTIAYPRQLYQTETIKLYLQF